MKAIPFFKLSGSGNDFIIIDNRDRATDHLDLTAFIRSVCRRKMSVGADGLILIERSDSVDFKWQFFNSDGSRAEMCGNGARCAARFAYINNIAGSRMSFETDAGIVSAHISGDRVKLKVPDPLDFRPDLILELESGPTPLSSINTGVPHVVLITDNIEGLDVLNLGRTIRYHERFAPAGTNVNFISPQEGNLISIRTYERGVEDETLACGTGSIAAALVAAHKCQKKSPLDVRTRSGGLLTIYFQHDRDLFRDIYLEGDARVIYRAELWEDAWKTG